MTIAVQRKDIEEAAVSQNIWDSYDTPIEYGFCFTDYKSTRDGQLLSSSYLDISKDVLKTMMQAVGLPFSANHVLHGAGYDLIFLKSHGMIAKIGKNHDPIDLFHPCFSIPLGWHQEPATDFTLALYAGEDITKEYCKNDQDSFKRAITNSGQDDFDVCGKTNLATVFCDGQEKLLLIDVDKRSNETLDDDIKEQKQSLYIELRQPDHSNMADVVREICHRIYCDDEDVSQWLPQIDRHQSLRHLFWKAHAAAPVDKPAAFKTFWDTCALWTHNPPEGACQLRRDYLTPSQGEIFSLYGISCIL